MEVPPVLAEYDVHRGILGTARAGGMPVTAHQLPPPPPPPPPPENPPPENPLEPEPDGVEAIVPPVVTAKPSIESANCA